MIGQPNLAKYTLLEEFGKYVDTFFAFGQENQVATASIAERIEPFTMHDAYHLRDDSRKSKTLADFAACVATVLACEWGYLTLRSFWTYWSSDYCPWN